MKSKSKKGLEVSKENLLSNGNLYPEKDSFTADNSIVALYDVSQYDVLANTIVVHDNLGIFTSRKTTRQLANEFWKINCFGFIFAKIMASYYHLKHLSFINFNVIYMPMGGASRRNCDWIGLHFVKNFYQHLKEAIFLTKDNVIIRMKFKKGDLEKKVHDVLILKSHMIHVFKLFLHSGKVELRVSDGVNLQDKFKTCHCSLHQELKTISEFQVIFHTWLTFILNHLGIESINPDAVRKVYCQNLTKLAKLY